MFHVEHHGRLVASELRKHGGSVGINLSQEQLDMVAVYAEELRAWNDKINLTTITSPTELAIKHFIDSLYGAPFLLTGSDCTVLDLGTGAGFPGIPLKIVNPDIDLHLLEKNKKKVAFLSHVIGRLKLPGARLMPTTIEEASKDVGRLGRFMNIVIRAVKFEDCAEGLTRLLDAPGRVIAYRTDDVVAGAIPATLKVRETVQYRLPLGYGDRKLVVLERT